MAGQDSAASIPKPKKKKIIARRLMVLPWKVTTRRLSLPDLPSIFSWKQFKIRHRPQHQEHPGLQAAMKPLPVDEDIGYIASGKLKGKVAIVTGGDSGIGRSVALLFAKEGADICIVYLNEHEDADLTIARIEKFGRRVIQFDGDLANPDFCEEVVQRTINAYGKIDILVNNAGQQDAVMGVGELNPAHVEKIFRTNIFSFFYLTRAALPHLKKGAAIINTSSIQAYDPSPKLMDYACTKAAI